MDVTFKVKRDDGCITVTKKVGEVTESEMVFCPGDIPGLVRAARHASKFTKTETEFPGHATS